MSKEIISWVIGDGLLVLTFKFWGQSDRWIRRFEDDSFAFKIPLFQSETTNLGGNQELRLQKEEKMVLSS